MSTDPRSWRRHEVVDYWDAPQVAGLDFEQQGLRLFLLDRLWRYGSLPANKEYLVRLCAGRVRDPATIDLVVKTCFKVDDDGMITSPEIEAERSRADGLRATRGAAARLARGRPSISSANAQHKQSKTSADAEQMPSTGSVLQGDVDVDVDVDGDGDDDVDGDGERRARAKPSRRPRAKTSKSSHKEFAEFWCRSFEETKGAPYAFQGGKDGKHVEAILEAAGGDLRRAKEVALQLLRSNDKFYCDKGVDLGLLRSQWNRLTSAGSSSSQRAEPRGFAGIRAAMDGSATARSSLGVLREPPKEDK
jgi:uncharacterized protein YdaU (DUF1376 family)